MTAQELKETGQQLLKSGQYAEAIPLLRSAAEALPKDDSVWSDLLLAASGNGQHDQAADFGKQGIRHFPRSDWLYRHKLKNSSPNSGSGIVRFHDAIADATPGRRGMGGGGFCRKRSGAEFLPGIVAWRRNGQTGEMIQLFQS